MDYVLRVTMKQVLYDPFGEITILIPNPQTSYYPPQIGKVISHVCLLLRLRSGFLFHRILNAKTQTMTYVLFI